MTMFWLKTQAGWRETNRMEHSGTLGTYDLTKLSDDQLRQLAAILGPAAAIGGDSPGDPEA
jgi:phage terminase small subunit